MASEPEQRAIKGLRLQRTGLYEPPSVASMNRSGSSPYGQQDSVSPLPDRTIYQHHPQQSRYSAPTSPVAARSNPTRRQNSTSSYGEIPSDASSPTSQHQQVWSSGASSGRNSFGEDSSPTIQRAATIDLSAHSCVLREHATHMNFDKLGPYRQLDLPSQEELTSTIRTLYQPLGLSQTRIIKLLPNKYEEPLECRLLTVVLIDDAGVPDPDSPNEIIRYDALSYAWGKSDLSSVIRCNGNRLAISSNLSDALHFLRGEEGVRYLWVDGICIDQTNDIEKSHQVQKMLRIFEKARSVTAWIGLPRYVPWGKHDSINETKWLFSALKDPGLVKCMLQDDFGPRGGHCGDCNKIANDLYELLIDHCERSWFGRTWIRQEVFATDTVILQCGHETMSLHSFLDSLFAFAAMRESGTARGFQPHHRGDSPIKHKHLMPPKVCNTLKSDISHARTTLPGYPLPTHHRRYATHWLRVLQDGTDFDVTDPKDKVYGALGMLSSETIRFYVEDTHDIRAAFRHYSRAVDYRKDLPTIYADVVKLLINSDRNLDVLTVFENRNNNAADLASYAIDWRRNLDRSFIASPPSRQAESGIFLNPQLQNIDGVISLKGRLVGPLYVIESSLSSVTTEMLASIWPPLSHMSGNYTDFILNQRIHALAYRRPLNVSKSAGLHRDFSSALLVPRTATIDDVVVALHGGRTLFLLRPTETEDAFRFVGPLCSFPEERQMRTWVAPDTGKEYRIPAILTWDKIPAETIKTFRII